MQSNGEIVGDTGGIAFYCKCDIAQPGLNDLDILQYYRVCEVTQR